MSEDRIEGGNAEIAGQSEVESTAHAVSLNGGDRRCREEVYRVHETLAKLRKFKSCCRPGEPGDLIQICAGGEEMFIAGDDQRNRILCEIINCSFQRMHTCAGKLVGVVGRDQAQQGAIGGAVKSVEVGHGIENSRNDLTNQNHKLRGDLALTRQAKGQ